MSALEPAAGLSKNHRLVFEIVTEQGVGTHLSMAQIFELARERRPEIGFTTVYRALSRLRDLRLVSEISLPGAESVVYEPASMPHAHFRCTSCGRVDDVAISPDASALTGKHDFVIDRVELSLHGLCANCKP